MTNMTMFVYTYGIVMKQGTANAWNKAFKLSKENAQIKRWFESPYVQSMSNDQALLKELDRNGL